jgi:mono/diheme cytochrome c family protein
MPSCQCDWETKEAIMLRKTILAASAAILGTFSAATAEDHAGKEEFMVACAVCHGESAKGDGPFASMMNVEVPGLTGLAAANDGVFPFLKAFEIVDGRTGVRAHGGPMPIWGNRFKSDSSEIITRGRIAVLVDYLQSIQE